MLHGTMCHHLERARLEEHEAELENVADEPPEADTPGVEDVEEPDEEYELLEVPPADD